MRPLKGFLEKVDGIALYLSILYHSRKYAVQTSTHRQPAKADMSVPIRKNILCLTVALYPIKLLLGVKKLDHRYKEEAISTYVSKHSRLEYTRRAGYKSKEERRDKEKSNSKTHPVEKPPGSQKQPNGPPQYPPPRTGGKTGPRAATPRQARTCSAYRAQTAPASRTGLGSGPCMGSRPCAGGLCRGRRAGRGISWWMSLLGCRGFRGGIGGWGGTFISPPFVSITTTFEREDSRNRR